MRAFVLPNYKFLIEIGGMYVGGFSEISGLSSELELHEYAEGGQNDFVHKFPSRKRSGNIVLKRGVTMSSFLWDWYSDTMVGQVELLNGTIIVQNRMGVPMQWYNFFDAFPVKWNGPQFDANRADVAIESLELAHSGFQTTLSRMLK
jgi:phage tail-like protein